MKNSVPPTVRTRVAPGASPEVARARALYFKALKRRVEDGSYLTPRRLDTALERLLQAVKDDLPDDRK